MFIYTATEAWFCGFAKRLRRGLLRKWLMQKFKMKGMDSWGLASWFVSIWPRVGEQHPIFSSYVPEIVRNKCWNRFAHTTWGCGRKVSSCFIFHVMLAVPLHGCMSHNVCARIVFWCFLHFSCLQCGSANLAAAQSALGSAQRETEKQLLDQDGAGSRTISNYHCNIL